MNLIIDVGNTLVKFAVYQQDKMLVKQVVASEDARETFNSIIHSHAIEKAILSSVGRLNPGFVEGLDIHFKILQLNKTVSLPFINAYKTPETLGVDRMALVSAAVQKHPQSNVLVIDAGTCITYDFVTEQNTYLGGAISPGIRLRYKSLNNLTANLPLLDTEIPKAITGNTTATSIHSGVVYGILKEIDGVIEEYQDKYADLTVILTGGDADFLSKQLKNGIFANSNFLLDGLNFILEFNSQ